MKLTQKIQLQKIGMVLEILNPRQPSCGQLIAILTISHYDVTK